MVKQGLGFALALCVVCSPSSTSAAGPASQAASPAQGGGQAPAAPQKREKSEPVQAGSTQGGRTTSEGDAIPKFNMEYFVGEWTFEGDLADSPLGEGGKISGTETIRNVWDGKFWDIAVTGKEVDGRPFTGKGIFFYFDSFGGQFFTRYELTRGIATLKSGTLSCDLGMTCGLHYQTPPFEHNGALLQLRGRYYLTGAYSYRLFTEISVNKEEYTNLGSIWYSRDERAPKPDPIK